jgi:hypothetical protein
MSKGYEEILTGKVTFRHGHKFFSGTDIYLIKKVVNECILVLKMSNIKARSLRMN